MSDDRFTHEGISGRRTETEPENRYHTLHPERKHACQPRIKPLFHTDKQPIFKRDSNATSIPDFLHACTY